MRDWGNFSKGHAVYVFKQLDSFYFKTAEERQAALLRAMKNNPESSKKSGKINLVIGPFAFVVKKLQFPTNRLNKIILTPACYLCING
jgi:hypothetical protein